MILTRKLSKANVSLIDDNFDEAIYLYQQCIQENSEIYSSYFKLGLALLLSDRQLEAQEVWFSCIAQAEISRIDELTAELIKILEAETIQRFGNKKINHAELIASQILEIDPQNSKAYKHLGNIFLYRNKFDLAIDYYKHSLLIDPVYIDSCKQLGNAFFKKGNSQDAILAYQKALSIKPDQIDVLFNLGIVFQNSGDLENAEECYKKSIELGASFHQCFFNLGKVFELKKNSVLSSLYLGLSLYHQQKYEEAIEELNFYLKKTTEYEFPFKVLFHCYIEINDFDSALKVARHAIETSPDIYYTLEFQSQLISPIIYRNKGELDDRRRQIHQYLREIIQRTNTDTRQDCQSVLSATSDHVNFYLTYQCEDDTQFQKDYGLFVSKIMSTCFPDFTKHRALRFSENRKIRVGYISSHFKYHTISKYFLGWVRYFNAEEFEVFTYYAGELRDYVTQEFITHSTHFYHLPNGIEEICNQIIENQLDILVYTDIGMNPRLMQLAALRLAPIQCAAWGHPVTTGLPTIDYYLTCDLMEPENAQEQYYLEQLIRLPNIGVAYDRPKLPSRRIDREDFGIRLDATVYLSCQSVFKYLPQYDYIFAEIARKVPEAQLVFVNPPGSSLASQFRQRIQTAFSNCELDYQKYCLFIPRQNREGYVNLNLVSDVFLDTLGWSGGNTTLEAIAYGLPVVTLPGVFMRGRQSYGFLKLIEVTETIATSEEDYIEIAVKLGLDRQWRHQIVQKMANTQHLLFEDTECVEALESFYRNAIKNHS
jgi:protein O-GlcNAc transferase